MADYRFYFLERKGHIRHAVEVVCGSDEEAIAAVERRREADAMELWAGDRVVKKFPARRDDDRASSDWRASFDSSADAVRPIAIGLVSSRGTR
jgi:hypothetical protein